MFTANSSVLRKILLVWLLWLGMGPLYAGDNGLPAVTLIETRDFGVLAKQPGLTDKPLLLVFVADYCQYCKTLEEEVLKPMLRNRDYDALVTIRLFKIDDPSTVTDFNGETISPDQFAARYHAKVTPTAVMLDLKGREIAPRIIGIPNIEYYGAELDAAIEQALDRIRKSTRQPEPAKHHAGQ